MERLGKWIKPAGFILMLVSVAFIIRTLFTLSIDFSRIVSIQNLIVVGLLSVLIYTANIFAMAFGWRKILVFIAEKSVDDKDMYHAYVKANIAKYLPGNFMHYAGRNLLGVKYGFEQLDIAFASLTEIGMQILSALLLSALFSGRQLIGALQGQIESVQLITIVPVLFLIIVFFLTLIVRMHKKKDRFIKYKLFFTARFWRFAIRIIPLYLIVSLLTGGILVLTLQFVLEADAIGHMGAVLMAYIIAWLAGFITPGAPGGVGVREAVLYFLLTPVLGQEMTILAAVIQRLFSITGDIVAFVTQLAAQVRKRKQES